MEVRSAINILFSKFNVNYRVFLYLFVVIVLVLAISVSIIVPSFTAVFKSPETAELYSEVRVAFADYLGGSKGFSGVTESVSHLYHKIVDLLNASNATAIFWVTLVITCFFIRLVMSFSYPAISDIMNNFMSSNMSYGFLSNVLKNAKLCAKYAFFHTLITLTLDFGIVFAVYGIIKGLFPLIKVFAFAVGLVAAVILFSARLTFSAGILPEMIVGEEKSYFAAIRKGLSYTIKYFGKIFGSFCISTFCLYGIVAVLSVVTFGVAFFVLGAMFVTYVQVLQLVLYYESKSMRYYTDAYTIVNTAPIEQRIDLQEELLEKDDD